MDNQSPRKADIFSWLTSSHFESDISLYEESDEESDGENDQDLNPTYLWTVQNSDRFEYPHDSS
jgi:hypothetical protein